LSIISISVYETVALISAPAFAFFIFRFSIVEVNSLDHFSILADTGSPAFFRSVDNSREFNFVFSIAISVCYTPVESSKLSFILSPVIIVTINILEVDI
jgi:hypothetical protein